MSYSKKRGVESLDEIILLVIHHIWKDFIQFSPTVDINTREEASYFYVDHSLPIQGVYLSWKIIQDLKQLRDALTWFDIADIIWRIFFGTILYRSSLLISVSSERFDNSTLCEDPLTECDWDYARSRHKKPATRERSLAVMVSTLMIAYLQYTSFNTSSLQRRLTIATNVEIEYAGLNYLHQRKIDTSALDISGLYFAHRLSSRVHCKKKDSSNMPTYVTDAEFLIGNVTGLTNVQNVSLSNVTATDAGLQFSVNNSFLTNLITFFSIILNVVILSSSIVETAPIGEKVVRKATKRVSNSFNSLVVELKGSPNTGYCAEMIFGSQTDQQEFCMLVDTGSSNLAVAAKALSGVEDHFTMQAEDTSLVSMNMPVSVTYSGGKWSGTLARDRVSIGGSQPVEVEFALINSASNFFISGAEWSGILGLAYDSLAKPDSSVEPFWGVLQRTSGLRDTFALSICPHINFVNQGGLMEFGDVSDTLYRGPLLYTSITEELYYNVLVTNLTVGDHQIELHCSEFNNDKAIIDSGTTDIYLPSVTYTAVVQVLKKHFEDNLPFEVPESFWNGGSKLTWPTDSKWLLFEAFPTLHIGFAIDQDSSSEFALAVPAQLYLRQVSGTQEEKERADCLPECDFFVFGIKQREKGMVIGGNVMLGFTTVFDREQKRVGFAKSICNYADNTQGHIPYITGPYPRDSVDCECHGCSINLAYWEWIVYVCGAIVFIILFLSVGYTIVKKCQKCRNYSCSKIVCCESHCCNRTRYSLGYSNEVATEENSNSDREAFSIEETVPHNQASVSGSVSEVDSPSAMMGEEKLSLSHEEQSASLKSSYASPSLNFGRQGNYTLLQLPHKPLSYLPDAN